MFIISDKLIFLVTSVLTQALRVLTSFIVLRFLVPEDYGLLGLVAILPGYLSPLGDFGIARALVQFRDLPAEVVESCALIVSLTLAGVYASAYSGSGLYLYLYGYHVHNLLVLHDVRMILVGLVGAVTLILATIYTFQMSCLNRDLRFRAEAFQNLIFATALSATGISLALVAHHHRPFGVFAVALQPLVAQSIGNAVIYHRHPFRWPRAFQFAVAKKMLNYGWKVTAAQYANNLLQSLANTFILVVGGVGGLGVYGRATQVSDMIGFSLLSSFDRVLHPLLRSVRDDEQRLRDLFIRGCIASMLVCIFGWAWVAGNAPDLIRVVMGPQWSGVPSLLRVVSISLLVAGPGAIGIVLVNALGKPLVWLKYGVISVAVLCAAAGSSLIIHRSLEAIAGTYVLSQCVMNILLWAWASRTLGSESKKVIGHAVRLALVGAATVGCIIFARHFFTTPLLRLIVGSGVAGIVFIGLVLLVDREAILNFRTLIQRRGPTAPPAPLSIGPDGRQMTELEVPGDDRPS